MKRFEEIPHTADLAAKIYGKDMKELFRNAAFAMFSMMSDMGGAASGKTVEVGVSAKTPDREALLVAWLNELLYLSFRNKLVFSDFEIDELKPGMLNGRAHGVPIEKEKLHFEIKAATYHDVHIIERDGTYEVTIVFDV